MRIGIFTDTYHPATNGIVFVVDIIRKNLTALGHEVIIFAPETRMRFWRRSEPGVVRFPAIEGIFFDEQSTSFFFPPTRLKKIQALELDAVLIMTPGQIALMGAFAALGDGIPLYFQYSTDLISYIEQYPSVIPGVIALLMSTPFALRLRPREIASLTAALARQRNRHLTWKQDFAAKTLTVLYDRCSGLIGVSKKTAAELRASGTRTKVAVIPTGVDPLPIDMKAARRFREQWLHGAHGPVYLYVGRMGSEKNLDLLIDAFAAVVAEEPQSVLVMIGGFSYREELERRAEALGIKQCVRFVGRLPREKLGSAYAAADVFCFPSLTDTQALVLNEAAHAGLPLIWCDDGLNDVLRHRRSGLKAEPDAAAFTAAMLRLGRDEALRRRYGANAKALAATMTERLQAERLADFLGC